MPRRLILSATERVTLLALPESQDYLIRYYTFNDSDLSLIRQRRGDTNRLGFAVQLCLLRCPGYAPASDSDLPESVIQWVAKQVQAEPTSWAKYGERDVIPRDAFTESVREAELLARPEGFDHLHLGGENLATLRRYTPALLEVLELRAAPAAQGVLAAVETLREMNADNLRKVPADAPIAFIKPRWKALVITPEGLDRRFYEICALSELKNALRSGDIWGKGSRQIRDFDDYLLPVEKFSALKREQALPLAINPNSDQYLEERLRLLDEQLATVTRFTKDNELPDAILTDSGLKITPLDASVPDRAQALIDQAGGRQAAAIPVAVGLGAHQTDRRLRLAAEP